MSVNRGSFLVKTLVPVLVFMTIFAEGSQSRETKVPVVAIAVAPAFLPFVFGKSRDERVVIEVKIDKAGEVISAKTGEFTRYTDDSFEATAKRWRFDPSQESEERSARITFLFRTLPKGTPENELTPIFTYPFQIEVRHEVFEPLIYNEAPTVPSRTHKSNGARKN